MKNNQLYKEASEIDYSTFIAEQEEKLANLKMLKERREKRMAATNPHFQRMMKDIEQLEQQLAELKADQQGAGQAAQIREGGLR